MSFNWVDYQELAKTIKDSANGTCLDEAKLRCALSRAYYAAFCSARNFLMTQDSRITTDISHRDLRSEYKKRGNKGNIVANKLLSMSDKRHCADYRDIYPEDLKKEAEFALEEAQKVIMMVSNWGKPGSI